MPERDHLTILHLSDMQFGRNHLFQDKVPYPDGRFESLWERLRDDLDERREQQGLEPDLVVVSGDLAEWGLPSEFKQAGTFLEQLTEHLNLPRRRVVIIPGNHDVNRKACSSYFDECASEEKPPQPPFWPKWKNFAD